MNKGDIRRFFKKRRLDLDIVEAEERSREISANFVKVLPIIAGSNSHSKVFSIYHSQFKEVSCEYIKSFFKQNKIRYCFPKVIDNNSPLEFVEFLEEERFDQSTVYKNAFLEPSSAHITTPDIIIVPLVAFDTNLSRIGMGAGLFDRTIELLRNNNKNLITIGLAYDFQLYDSIIETDHYDQKLDFILTETRLFSQAAITAFS